MKTLCNKKSKKELKKEIEVENFKRLTFSFYKYVPIKNPQKVRDFLYENLEALNCKGRIYIAKEGVNVQMNVPEKNFSKLKFFFQSTENFKDIFYNFDLEEKCKSSFLKLIVKVKNQIVFDGIFDKNFNPTNTGKHLEAEKVNEAIESKDFVVVDMRNFYESEVGHFKNSKLMQVDTFRQQLKEAENFLKDKKDKKILTYCTGGIRCEKASAFLKHKGFKNVFQVKGGIINYLREVQNKKLENKFLGKNFVFDERMGEKVSSEIISKCHLCLKNKSDEHFHCKNQTCHILFLACDKCLNKKKNYCSYSCMAFDKLPQKIKKKIVPFLPKAKSFKKSYALKKNILKWK